ncbi:phosphoenolpyruvate--protein phosphotransferase [Desulfothermus naphthae]
MAKKVLQGIPISVGIAIGRAYILTRDHFCLTPIQNISEELVDQELKRLEDAFDLTISNLKELKAKIPEEQTEYSSIIDTHIMMLQDPKLKSAITKYIKDMKLNAEWAIEKGVKDIENSFKGIEDEFFKTRISEIKLLSRKVIGNLIGAEEELKPIKSRVILVAHELTPADTVELDVSKIMAFVTAQGGKTSHVSIVARTLEIPAIVGIEDVENLIPDDELIIVDGFTGKVLIKPEEEEIYEYTERQISFEQYKRELFQQRGLPGKTKDGFHVKVMANIELFEEVSSVLDYAAEGIGLYRTEYSYLYRSKLPSEEELYEEYRDLVSIMSPKPVVIRTLDAGGDKIGKGFEKLEEANPAMGLRAIRFCLKFKKIFKTQLKAILRAAKAGNAFLMFPMISGLEELREAKKVLEEAKNELEKEGRSYKKDIPVGIMVELPSAVLVAQDLAKEVDFFSIGTNDLIQYSLGIDRTNKYVSHLYQPLHPAIIKSIKYTVDVAKKAGIHVSMCGEMAGDPFCLPLLIGMGVDILSTTPHSVPGVKRVVRMLSKKECEDLLHRILQNSSVKENNKIVKEKVFDKIPEELTFYTSFFDN